MATKEDILEQIVEEYLLHKGYFVRHNDKFRPSKTHASYNSRLDSVNSDIDVIGINPTKKGTDRIWVVNCKSWQDGLRIGRWLNWIDGNSDVSKKSAWKYFREIADDKWSEAFVEEVKRLTGSDKFTYAIAATVIKGERAAWERHKEFRRRIKNNPIRIIDLQEMVNEIIGELKGTQAATEVGRMLQLFKAADLLPS